jgi:hypothetical protein
LTFDFPGALLTVDEPIRSLICFAIVKKACSTLVDDFADVSKKGMLSWSANSCEEGVSSGSSPSHFIEIYLCDIVLDNLLCRQVTLVTDEEFVDAFARISVNFLQPLLDIGKSVYRNVLLSVNWIPFSPIFYALTLISHIVDYNNTMRSSVIR